MATQSGITVAKANDPYTISTNIPVPSPGPKQVLLKTLAVAMNPVESFLKQGGLVTEWPCVVGAEGCGVVVQTGDGCAKLKKGDIAYGCVRVGQNKYSSFQDSFLADEDLILKKSENISVEDACTIGVGLMTAGLGMLTGGNLEMPKPGTKAVEKDEWIIVIGGSGTVGQFGVQFARLCGYKVAASCSPSKASAALSQGAAATFNGRASMDKQLREIKKITGGKFARIFDASAYGHELCVTALDTLSAEKTKYYSTVDDWTPHDDTPSSITEYRVELGHIGRFDDPIGGLVSRLIAKYVPDWEAHIANGALKPLDRQVVEGMGWDKVLEGISIMEGGKASKKVVVRLQAE